MTPKTFTASTQMIKSLTVVVIILFPIFLLGSSIIDSTFFRSPLGLTFVTVIYFLIFGLISFVPTSRMPLQYPLKIIIDRGGLAVRFLLGSKEITSNESVKLLVADIQLQGAGIL